ncbi:MAG: dihydropteroate synthase [Ekhidna sp.]|nr:dihydropteroate synthase [Ekhidna sp.]MBC6425546.1 dihydropteroate synthase [Ekhidna sp.]
MGIINVTPDSFFPGSRKQALNEILKAGERMLSEGAAFLDVGGYSSRPGADDISVEQELERVLKPIRLLKTEFPKAIISIDTFRSEVAAKAVGEGAGIVNDISGGHLDGKMLPTVAKLKVPYIAMHMRGTPQTMKILTDYEDILIEVSKYFSKILRNSNEFGIKDVILDVGFGFAKGVAQSFHLLKHLEYLQWLDRPMLVGVSRKSMIYQTLDLTADEALNGTTVLNTLALFKGVGILRVHDVREAVQAIKLLERLK